MADFVAHESAYVDPGAQIGEGTHIWHFCHIMPDTVIGPDCTLGQNTFVANNVIIGAHVKIQNNVSIFEGVVLEDYVFCGPSMVFTNVKTPRSAFPRNTGKDYLVTRVRYGASIGANATILCGIEIGEWAFIAAGAVVTRSVPAYALMAGMPALQIGWACQCGVKLVQCSDTYHQCPECKRSYVLTSAGLHRGEDGDLPGGSLLQGPAE